MAKGKGKMNRSDSLAPPQPRSLRSRKRECPSDGISMTDDVQAALRHQDTEGHNPAVDTTLLQCHRAPLQESTVILTPQHQAAAEHSCLTEQDPAAEEKYAGTTNVMVNAFEGQEETNPNNDSQLEGCRVDHDNEANKSGKDRRKEEITAEECNSPPSPTCTDQLQVFLPTSEEADGSCATALEEQLGATENSQSNFERNQETSQDEPSDVYMADIKETRQEAAAWLPAKKRRRMGMCGLTEKERSHFLQTQKRENGQNGPERVEKQICNNAVDFEAQEEAISSPPSSPPIPVGSATEQNKAEIKLQRSQCGGDDRAETEVLVAVTTSDGTSTVCDPGCSKGKSSEAEGGTAPGPEQTGDTESDPPAEEEEEEQQELEGRAADIMAEKPQEQMKVGEDGSAVVHQSPAITSYSNPNPPIHSHQNEETQNRSAAEQVNSEARTRDEELTGDTGDGDGAEAGASSTDTRSGGLNCGSVEPCEAAVTPSGSERKDSCTPASEPGAGPSTLNAEHSQTRDSTDPFGSGYLDYVSDSQLNTIALAEEEVMEREEDFSSPDCHEDATDLVCGLIRELSSLNRKVMAAHRELENLRRSSKSSRSSIR